MAVLTRSVSATSSNRPYLTPHTPPSTHPRALIDMTPLPSLFDKIIEAAKRRKRSTSVQLESKVGEDPFALPSIPEESEGPTSDPVEVHDIQQPSDGPTEVGDEPEPVAQQASATDQMDFEDTPVVFSEPINHPPSPAHSVPPTAPVSVSFPIHEGASTSLLPSDPLCIYPETPVAP